MLVLIAGLVIFMSVLSVRIVAEDWRGRMRQQHGEAAWKGVYSILSLVGLLLIIRGYGMTRTNPVTQSHPPMAMWHVAALLTLVSFVLLTASNVPGNRIKRAVGHPMVLGVKVWAFAHLLANGRLGDVVLFGAFLVWAIVDFASARRRDRAVGGQPVIEVSVARDLAVVVIGVGAWIVFALWLHGWLIGVNPFG